MATPSIGGATATDTRPTPTPALEGVSYKTIELVLPDVAETQTHTIRLSASNTVADLQRLAEEKLHEALGGGGGELRACRLLGLPPASEGLCLGELKLKAPHRVVAILATTTDSTDSIATRLDDRHKHSAQPHSAWPYC